MLSTENLYHRLYNRKSQYAVGFVISFALFMGTLVPTAWQLDIYLDNPPFGVDRAEVTVGGPIGWTESGYLATGPPSIIASIDVPDREIPEGYQYRVCVGAGFFTFDLHCRYFTHGSGDESVRMNLAGT